VSRSEAGQQKHLLVLDSNWQQTDEILLDIGPRFHAMAGAEPALPQDLRPGDRSATLLRPLLLPAPDLAHTAAAVISLLYLHGQTETLPYPSQGEDLVKCFAGSQKN